MNNNIFSELSGYIDESENHRTLSMKCEAVRLQSYHWVKVVTSTIRLASAGFYATGKNDETKCYSCGALHRGWKSTDNPALLHRQMSSNCRHMAEIDTDIGSALFEPRLMQMTYQDNPQSVTDNNANTWHFNSGVAGTTALLAAPFDKGISDASSTALASSAATKSRLRILTEMDSSVSDAVTNVSWEGNGRNENTLRMTSLRFDNAVYPHYSEMAERLKSFTTWPKGHCKRPQELVIVGLFYAGYSDCVRCYVCGVGLRTWESEDDAWTEHVRWRSSCDYVAAIKGPDFAMQTLAALGRDNRIADGYDTSYNSKPPENDDILETDECRRALEMGFNFHQVRQTAMTVTRTGDKTSLTLEVLLERMIADAAVTTVGSQQTQLTDSAHERRPLASRNKIEPKNHPEDDRHSGKSTTSGAETQGNQKTSNRIEVKQQMPSTGMRSSAAVSNRCHNSLPPQGASGNLDKTKTTDSENSKSSPCYSQTSDEDENRELKESSLCKVCLDEPANIVFLPCGHLVSCVTCSPALERCPLCRKHIRGTVRVYLANMKSMKQDS